MKVKDPLMRVHAAGDETVKIGTDLGVEFSVNTYGAGVTLTITDTDPEGDNDATTTIYDDDIKKLAEWLTLHVEAAECAK